MAEAHQLGFYTNLITSGVGLNEARLRDLKKAGLDHIQLSFQDSTQKMNDFLSSTRTFELKSAVAALIKQYDYPMVLNVVLHRLNIDHVEEILEMALRLGADYVELANTQYYGWAWHNREQLLPSRAQVERAEQTMQRFRERVGSRMQIFFVVPDYFETRPKPCMKGLGSIFLTITPDGAALPCHAARMLPGLEFPNVRSAGVATIWYESESFNHFRGDAWMKEPCRSCPGKGARLRRLPLPGVPADGGCGERRPGLRSVAASPFGDRSGGQGGSCDGRCAGKAAGVPQPAQFVYAVSRAGWSKAEASRGEDDELVDLGFHHRRCG